MNLMTSVFSLLSILSTAAEPGISMIGRVLDDTGSPVTNATVIIYAAHPKSGVGIFCPTCYPDCRRKASTGSDGGFAIDSLDPELLYHILILAKGRASRSIDKVDPANGRQEVALPLVDPTLLASNSRAAGMMIGPDGKAVAGAVIIIEGAELEGRTQWGGTDRHVDPMIVTDEDGRFVLRCDGTVTAVHILVEAPKVARKLVRLIPGRDYLIRMDEGASVTGRVMRDGQPISRAVVGLITQERGSGVSLHDFEAMTGEDGRFKISNVTANNRYLIFSKMESLHEAGTVPINPITVAGSGTAMDLSDLPLQPAYRVSGRVVLSDGGPIPKRTRLSLGRDSAWDHQEAILDQDGRFDFRGVPGESVALFIRINGYKLSKKNPSLDWLNNSIIGRVSGDIPDLILLLEPGKWKFNGGEGEPLDGESQPRERPLRGVKL